jgi:hypothetical protein
MKRAMAVVGLVLSTWINHAQAAPAATQPAPSGKVLAVAAPALTARVPRVIAARTVEPGRLNEITVTRKDVGARVVLRRLTRGVELVVSARVDGELETETYSAVDEAELERQQPAAHRLYDAVLTEAAGGPTEAVKLREWFDQPAELRR